MPLIFAIDSDKRQSAQLASLLRSHVDADLVQSASAVEGLEILQGRVPDLILTSSLLSPRDETALDNYLRELGVAAAHVQTLTVPVIAGASAASGKKKKPAGMLAALRRTKKPAAKPSGCDPDVFAGEVQLYLERAMEQREALRAVLPENVPTPVVDAETAESLIAAVTSVEPEAEPPTVVMLAPTVVAVVVKQPHAAQPEAVQLEPEPEPAAGDSGGGAVDHPAAGTGIHTHQPAADDAGRRDRDRDRPDGAAAGAAGGHGGSRRTAAGRACTGARAAAGATARARPRAGRGRPAGTRAGARIHRTSRNRSGRAACSRASRGAGFGPVLVVRGAPRANRCRWINCCSASSRDAGDTAALTELAPAEPEVAEAAAPTAAAPTEPAPIELAAIEPTAIEAGAEPDVVEPIALGSEPESLENAQFAALLAPPPTRIADAIRMPEEPVPTIDMVECHDLDALADDFVASGLTADLPDRP